MAEILPLRFKTLSNQSINSFLKTQNVNNLYAQSLLKRYVSLNLSSITARFYLENGRFGK